MALKLSTPAESFQTTFNGHNILKPEDIEKIHSGALHLLEKVGLKVEDKEAADIFYSSGAAIETTDSFYNVKIPPSIVEDCISQAPKRLTYYGREKKHDFTPQAGEIAFAAFGQCVNILDPISGKIRTSKKSDMAKSAILQDALPNLRTVARTMAPGDQSPESQAIHCIDAIARNTGKHISGGAANGRTLGMIIQLLETAAGGSEVFKLRPFYSPSFCPTSPLTLGKECCQVAIGAATYGLNTVVMIMPLSGGTGPVTLPGTVTLGIAEQLSGIVLTQLTSKGTPITLGSATTIMDLKTGVGAMGAPESGMINACLAQIAQYYQLPCRVACGVSDSCVQDAQIGYEFAINAMTVAMAGATIIFGGGALESGLTHSPAKLVMDHECMSHIHQIFNGIQIDDEAIALDVVSDTGPGNSFLMHSHTFDRMKNQSKSIVFNRNPRDTWKELKSSKIVSILAAEKVMEIIDNHTPPPLPEGTERVIAEMLKDFEAQLKS